MRTYANSVADFFTSALLKPLKVNLLYPKKSDGEAYRSAEVQNFTIEFSHGLDISSIRINLIEKIFVFVFFYILPSNHIKCVTETTRTSFSQVFPLFYRKVLETKVSQSSAAPITL